MEQPDPQQRIAELELQLAQQKRIADLERQLADAKAAAVDVRPVEQPAEISAAQMAPTGRGAFAPQRYGGGLSAPRRNRGGAGWVGVIVAMLGAVLGVCVGGAAAVTALFPSTALWMGPIVCPGGYAMAYNTSHYSYKPGQSGTTVSFQCVGDGDFYDVNDFAVFALQSLLVALVLGVALAIGGVIWRRSHRPGRSPAGW